MKYKVGDKVRIREDLVMGGNYGGSVAVDDMTDMAGSVVTIERVGEAFGYYIEEDPDDYCWTDEMFEPVEEMSAAEALKAFTEICGEHMCYKCPVGKIDKDLNCREIKIQKPEKVVEVLKQWKADHEKMEVATKIAKVIVIIEETEDGKKCVYEEETDMPVGHHEAVMEKILKKWYEEHDGKFFAVLERRCVARGVDYEYRRKD